MRRLFPTVCTFAACAIACLATAAAARATDIPGVQPAALDQPRINAFLRRSPTGAPISGDIGLGPSFNIEAFYDTGASGILLSNDTADALGIQRATSGGQQVTFKDVGVAGSDQFNVSEPLHLALAPFHPNADVDNRATYASVYNQTFGPVRTQIGPLGASPNPLLQGVDVIGMPAMAGKVVVIDPKPVDTLTDTMRTYVYNPGTPFSPTAADTNPGIPTTNLHVKLSYASFDRFTDISPAGAPGPSLRNNPFIGPNPVAQLSANPPADATPAISIARGNNLSSGSFLLDTGAATSIISLHEAANVHVRYVAGTDGTDNPRLESFDPAHPQVPGTPLAEQFQLTVGGVGGTHKAAGFYLDSLRVPTIEANPASSSDPRNLKFLHAPVLVSDITVKDPHTLQSLTLDGVLGMNYLAANVLVSEGSPPTFGNETPGAFDWLVFNEPAGVLGLQLKTSFPLTADMNGDGFADNFDIAPFQLALTDHNAYLARYPRLSDYALRGDINGDGQFNNFDIGPFQRLLTGAAAAASMDQAAMVPEPSSLALATIGAIGMVVVVARRRSMHGRPRSPTVPCPDDRG